MKAFVLAGGFPQIALIKELKKRFIYVVLADYNFQPIAKPYADTFYQASTLDIDVIEHIARQEKVDFLITACTDQALFTVALVSKRLGLPCYIDYNTALKVTNKAYMKEMFIKNGIPTAKYIKASNLNEKAIAFLRYPLVVKPVDCNSSKGIRKISNKQQLQNAFVEASNYSRSKEVIIEEYIEGIELSIDVYVEKGKAHILAVTNSDKILSKDKFIIFRTRYPAMNITKKLYNIIEKTVQKIADVFNLIDSPMIVQLITDGETISILEFSARTGGAAKYIIIKKICGVDVIEAIVDLTLGNKPHIVLKKPENKYISNEFIYCKPGIFSDLAGFEELKTTGVLSDYYLFKWYGARFERIENSGDRIAGFTIQGNTKTEMIAKHRIAVNKLKVLDTERNDMMRHDLLTDWY